MLRNLLKEKNISQRRVVKETGVSMSGLHNYMNEKREMPVSLAKKIAPILKVNWWELYEEDEMKKYYKHSFTDDKGRKVYEASDGERLINTDIKDDRISKNTIAMIKEDGKTLRRLRYANTVSAVYKTASGDIAIIFKE